MSTNGTTESFDCVVVGGGPAGATAAQRLAQEGRSVLLLDKPGKIKPCGGAIPPKAIGDFNIPDSQLVCKVAGARVVSPKGRNVDMPIDDGFVGMVDRKDFDPWLRNRAALMGATYREGAYAGLERGKDGVAVVRYRPMGPDDGRNAPEVKVRAHMVIGADGANSQIRQTELPHGDEVPYVFAYHEIVRSPDAGAHAPATGGFDPGRCDVFYQGDVSPDFYGWVFPHGPCTSVGMGTAHKGFSLRGATAELRQRSGLQDAETVRREGAPLPLMPMKKWDNGRDVILAGDAAGVVAPASGEGIYYAMLSGEYAADAVHQALSATEPAKALATARKRFMKKHGQVFWILGIMQRYWYTTDQRRERFVRICQDRDVQRLTWDAYMNKELVKAEPLAHARIFWKNIFHLTGLAPV
jgi:geranylgeranyl reductase